MTMRTRAAVLWAAGEPLRLAEVELAAPGPHEVLVRIEASGVCHSDWNAATGTSAAALPAVPGHEGSGVVEATGEAVTAVAAGQKVLLSWLPACGACPPCQRGRPVLCEVATQQMAAGSLPGGGFRLSCEGRRLHHYSYLSTLAGHAVVHERSCIPVPAGTDPEVAALVGCAVMTGIGAVINRARVRPGSTVAVFGAGGVGLSAIMGARLAGAESIIAVEPAAPRRALALELGATLALDASSPQLTEALLDHSHGGADYAFEAAGRPGLLESAFAVTRPGGMVVAIGIPPDGSGANAAHVNTVLGHRDGPAGTAWATALATPRAGFTPFMAVAAPGVAVVPPTLFVGKAAITGPAHANLTWGPAQAGVAKGVALALEEDVIALSELATLVLIAAVWVDPAADDAQQIYGNNVTATLGALRSGASGGPAAADFLAAARAPFNPFFRSA
jgi:formaldehyde-activating enzyme